MSKRPEAKERRCLSYKIMNTMANNKYTNLQAMQKQMKMVELKWQVQVELDCKYIYMQQYYQNVV